MAIRLILTLSSVGLAARSRGSMLTLVVLSSSDPVPSAAAEPADGGLVILKSQPQRTDPPFVKVCCYQDGAFEYDPWHGFFASYVHDRTSSSRRQPGRRAADCTARIV
jgi:hypothetical protein